MAAALYGGTAFADSPGAAVPVGAEGTTGVVESGPQQTGAPGFAPGDVAATPHGDGFSQSVGPEVVTFDPADTDLLLSVGWEAPAAGIDDDFEDHASRLLTFIAIADALGIDPEVGAMQANCGTPQERGQGPLVVQRAALVAAQAEAAAAHEALLRHQIDAQTVLAAVRESEAVLPEGESAADTIAALETELAAVAAQIAAIETDMAGRVTAIADMESQMAAAVAAMLPVSDPQAEWQFANLDVTGDGVVDAGDLQAALDRAGDTAPPAGPIE